MKVIWGIDFSAARYPATRIWLTEARIDSRGLFVYQISHLAARCSLKTASPIRKVLPVLKDLLLTHQPDWVGMDFPFALPFSLLKPSNYASFLQCFQQQFPKVDQFEQFCKRQCPQPMRLTDKRQQAPWSPCNLRLFRQTYWGIRGILTPLWQKSVIQILPFQPFYAGKTHLMEVCPASMLKLNGRYSPYKGRDEQRRRRRWQLVDWVQQTFLVRFAAGQIEKIIEQPGGDALDSLLAVLPAYRLWLRYGFIPLPAHPLAFVEGWIYTG